MIKIPALLLLGSSKNSPDFPNEPSSVSLLPSEKVSRFFAGRMRIVRGVGVCQSKKRIFTTALLLVFASIISYSQPLNDNCPNATPITIPASGQICITSNNIGATSTTWTGTPPCNVNPWTNDVWFTFVSTGTLNVITVKPSGNTPAQRLGLNVTSGVCSNLQSLGISCGMAVNNGDSVQVTQASPAGTQYHIDVGAFNGDGTFDLCISSSNPPPSPGTSCITATSICDMANFTLASGPAGTGAFSPGCFTFGANSSVWYKFSVSTSGTLAWLCTPTAPNTELDWALYDVTNGCANLLANELACNYHFANQSSSPIGMQPNSTTVCPISTSNTNNSEEICPSQTIQAGHTYAIFIDNFSNNMSGWDFSWAGSTFLMPSSQFIVAPDKICGSTGTVTITNNSIGTATQTWDFGDSTTSNAANPGTHIYPQPGTYIISLSTTFASGCSNVSSKSVQIIAFPTLNVTSDTICTGSQTTLTATPSVSGGTYSWSPGGFTTSSITVSPTTNTTYTVTYTSPDSCTVTGTGTVNVSTISLTLNTTVTNVDCFGAMDGKIVVSPTGSSPFSFAWSANAATGNVDSAVNLGPGNYVVTVTDQNSCTGQASSQITQPASPLSFTSVVTNVACKGGSSGAIALTPTGGTAAYSYAWNTTATTQNISNLVPGNYAVTVLDINQCPASASFQITEPATPLQFQNPTVVNVLCHDSASGSIALHVSGGIAPYTFSWSQNAQLNSSSANSLKAGTYIVTMADSNNCAISDTIPISEPPAITFGPQSVNNASCTGSNSGSATITPSGGTGNFIYTWNGTPGSNPQTGLAPGNYIVVVTDNNNCQASTTVTIGNAPLMLLSHSVQNVLCSGAADGSAAVSVSGGTPPFTYLWSNQDTSQKISSLNGGTYLCTVTDINSCSATISAFISEPTPLVPTTKAIAVRCKGDANGYIIITSTGATPPYDYSATLDWVNFHFALNDTIPGLTAGTYAVILSDNNGCTKTDTVTVPDAITDVFSITTDSTLCFGTQYNDGAIHINDSLINSPHQYSLDSGPFQYSGDFYQVSAGVHHIVAKNAFNCMTLLTATVGEPADGMATILPADTTLQLGQSVQLTTSFTPYPASSVISYNWSPSLGLSCIDCPNPVASPYTHITDYSLTITYNQNCQANASATIIEENQAKVFIPNSFSPNGDGFNDFFLIYGQAIKVIDLKIFNRWGEMVFESTNPFNGWDGTYKGTLQSPGVYTYAAQITFLDDTKIDKQGSVTLLR